MSLDPEWDFPIASGIGYIITYSIFSFLIYCVQLFLFNVHKHALTSKFIYLANSFQFLVFFLYFPVASLLNLYHYCLLYCPRLFDIVEVVVYA